VASKSEKLLT